MTETLTETPGVPVDPTLPPSMDLFAHSRANKRRASGLWIEVGPVNFPTVSFRIRPFSDPDIQARRDANERNLRAQFEIRNPEEELPHAARLTLNRESMTLAVTAIRGRFGLGPKGNPSGDDLIGAIADAAVKAGIPLKSVGQEDFLVMTGDEPLEATRMIAGVLFRYSEKLLGAILFQAQELQKKSDRAILEVGEDFVHGRVAELGLLA